MRVDQHLPNDQAAPTSGKLNAVADALSKWADELMDGRQVEPSVTGLRLMAIAVRSAACLPNPEQRAVPQDAAQPNRNISPICEP